MLLMIDNYDSFTYMLVQYFRELGEEVLVCRNDCITLGKIETLYPHYIVISPGPCNPDKAGISLQVIERFAGLIPILGVCLGHQAIGQAFGGRVIRASRLMHGKTSSIYHNGNTIFQGLPQPLTATRYHSLILDEEHLPSCLEITAVTKQDEIMAIRHKKLPLEGVQFHPESVLTQAGHKLLNNFLLQYKPVREGFLC